MGFHAIHGRRKFRREDASIDAWIGREEVVGSFGKYLFGINDGMTKRNMTYDWT